MRSRLFRRILVPDDFSRHAARALAVAADLAARHGGRLEVLHVIVPVYPPPELGAWLPASDLVPTETTRLRARLARLLGRRRVRYRCRVVVGDPLERIVEAARGLDSIVMATAGRTGLTRLVIGSVAEKVVRHAPVPVLTVPARGRRGRRAA